MSYFAPTLLALALLSFYVTADHTHIYNDNLAQLKNHSSLALQVSATWERTAKLSNKIHKLNIRIAEFNVSDSTEASSMMTSIAKALREATNAHSRVLPAQQHITGELLDDVLDIVQKYETRTGTTLYANQTTPDF